MFVCSFKASTFKILCAAFVCIALVAAVIALMPDSGTAQSVNKIVNSEEVKLSGIKTDEDRAELLSSLGIEVNPTPVQNGEVDVPKKFDAAMEKYNDLQKLQGFDLSKYRGKTVNRYTYEIISFADGAKSGGNPAYVTLIMKKDKVVGGDICCPESKEYAPLIKSK